MSFENRETKRKSVVSDIIGVGTSPQETKPVKEEEVMVRRTFYLKPEQVKAMAFEKADTGKDLSEIIRESLDLYFDGRMDKYK